MINRAELKNFGPIEQLDWQNLGKINLIIGNNGCGKSFLLKALYCSVRTLEEYKRGDNPDSINEILRRKLHWTFQTEEIGNLVNKKAESPLSFELMFNDELFKYHFGKKTTKEITSLENQVEPRSDNSIYLQAKEVLSLFHIILDSREHDQLFGFDDTYLDLVKALLRQQPRNLKGLESLIEFVKYAEKSGENKIVDSNKLFIELESVKKYLADHTEKVNYNVESLLKKNVKNVFQNCQKQLDKMIGGKIEYDTEVNRWQFKQGNQKFSVGVMAEGIKKIAILDTLLGNGYLNENSIIFIDEPESNLHPQAISQLLDIIAMLAKHGIQFFLASHSYFVVKKLFLIAQEQKISIPVLSYQNDEWVQSNLLDEMPDNPIIDESIKLYEEEVDLAFK